MISLIMFFVLLCALWILIEIISILFKLTGLELTKSRFQVISIITHTGFTTRESELIAQHPMRRRIASMLMIISYVAQITLIGLLLDSLGRNQSGGLTVLAAAVAILAVLVAISASRFVKSKFDRIAEGFLSRKLKNIRYSHIEKILNLSPEYNIYEFVVDSKSALCNRTLREVRLMDDYMQVLKIDRGVEVLDFPRADTRILAGDRLIVYGRISSIENMVVNGAQP